MTGRWVSPEIRDDIVTLLMALNEKTEIPLVKLLGFIGLKRAKRQHIRRVNTRLNLSVPEIVTPLELFKEQKPWLKVLYFKKNIKHKNALISKPTTISNNISKMPTTMLKN